MSTGATGQSLSAISSSFKVTTHLLSPTALYLAACTNSPQPGLVTYLTCLVRLCSSLLEHS
jgi:hypothetical protein